MIMLHFMYLVVEGVQHSEGQSVNLCNFHMMRLDYFFCTLLSKLLQIRATGKHLKYECKCKMHEKEMRVGT